MNDYSRRQKKIKTWRTIKTCRRRGGEKYYNLLMGMSLSSHYEAGIQGHSYRVFNHSNRGYTNMIIDVMSKQPISRMPHSREFNIWRSRLTEAEFDTIVDELNSKIEGEEVHTAGWMPGSDWTGTPFEPIYSKSCDCDVVQAALFFGLIVWYVFMNRPDYWSCGRFEKDGKAIRSITYFVVQP